MSPRTSIEKYNFMNTMKIRALYLSIIIITLLFTLFSCQNKHTGDRNISVSILPQKYFTERIAGDYVKVNVMIPPGMSPATCDLSTGQLKKLYDSDICFTIGYLPFETTHLYPVLENKKNIRLVNHSEGIQLISGSCGHHHETDQGNHPEAEEHEHESGVDPHIWLSPRYAGEMARTILTVLSEKYPEQKAVFEANYEKLISDIDQVANKADRILSGKQHKSFLIYHPALTYFAQEFGMEQVSIENEGKEPNPTHLKKIIDMVKEKNIHIVFIQSQFDANNAKSVAGETGGEVIPIDPLCEDWLAEMNRLLDIFDKKLQ